MSLDDVITTVRKDLLDDHIGDPQFYKWSNEQLKRFAFEALYEACKRAELLERTSRIPVRIGVADYTLDDHVRQIKTAKLDLSDDPLTQTTDAELSLFVGSSWRVSTGTPTHYVRSGRAIKLYKNPIVADTLVLVHSALPESEYDIDDVNPYYHNGLGSYIAYLAYLFPDADTYNPKKAREHLSDFDKFFGQGKSAKYDAFSQNTPMYGSIYGGRMA